MEGTEILDHIIDDNKKPSQSTVPGFERLSDVDFIKKERDIFRRVFSTQEGKIVLTQILEDLRYFSACRNDEDRALRNYATTLIQERIGIANTFNIVGKILETKE